MTCLEWGYKRTSTGCGPFILSTSTSLPRTFWIHCYKYKFSFMFYYTAFYAVNSIAKIALSSNQILLRLHVPVTQRKSLFYPWINYDTSSTLRTMSFDVPYWQISAETETCTICLFYLLKLLLKPHFKYWEFFNDTTWNFWKYLAVNIKHVLCGSLFNVTYGSLEHW